jgi:rRNA-processing protein FCF1
MGRELVVGMPPRGFVVDANVLIDYSNADLTVLGLLSKIVGPVLVSDAVLENVEDLDRNDCDQLGLAMAQPTLDQMLEAGEKRAKLAYDDWMCLILARDNGLLCITNDKALRAECSGAGVKVLWGLEPMLTLASHGVLEFEEAESVAWRIHENNPAFVTKTIVNRFLKKLQRIVSEPRPPRR